MREAREPAMNASADVIILGAGIASASAAAFLAPHGKVMLLEAEEQPGRHATGRSAATFFETYGNAAVRALVRASRDFLLAPPEGFASVPLMAQHDAMFIATASQLPRPARDAPGRGHCGSDARHRRRRRAATGAHARPAAWPAPCSTTPVSTWTWTRCCRASCVAPRLQGAKLRTDLGFDARIEYGGGVWRVHSRQGVLEAPVLVNAAGAWADQVAQRAGVQTIGLQPLRRSAVIIPSPQGTNTAAWPMVIDVDEHFYFKPDAGQLLLSPANEDPSPPCDAAADEMDVAIAVDRFETATTHRVKRILHRWAGLRSFVPDRTPVVGYAPDAPGFFWLAGQGGYGIETAPALGSLAASLAQGRGLPAGLAARGVDLAALLPERLDRGRSTPPS